MGDKTEAFDIFQTPLSSHYPLPLMVQAEHKKDYLFLSVLTVCSMNTLDSEPYEEREY